MPRPAKYRRIDQPPIMKGFMPYGIPACKLETLVISFEEFESLKLVSHEMLPQEEAARRMAISRPTLTRIYNRALRTIAQAFVEGKGIEIRGGNYRMDSEWFRCRKCHKLIEGVRNHRKCDQCPEFGRNELIRLNN